MTDAETWARAGAMVVVAIITVWGGKVAGRSSAKSTAKSELKALYDRLNAYGDRVAKLEAHQERDREAIAEDRRERLAALSEIRQRIDTYRANGGSRGN